MNWLSHFHKKIHSPIGFDCGHCQKPKRCCDFTPFFPNFLIGAGLVENPDLLKNFEASRMRPLGVFPFDHKRRDCDFFDSYGGRCLNWPWRPSECSNYFCKEGLERASRISPRVDLDANPVHGADSDLNVQSDFQKFQNQSELFFRFELYLSQMLLRRQGFSDDFIEHQVDEWNLFTEGQLSENSWSFSFEEKKKFYVSLWSDLKSLSWEEIMKAIPRHEKHFLSTNGE